MENKEFGPKICTWGHLGPERAQVARPRGTAPPKPVWPSNVASPPPFAYLLIYPENLPCQKHGVFCKPERHHHHDLRFGDQIGPALHAGEGDLDAVFTTIITNIISINHVLVLHHHV